MRSRVFSFALVAVALALGCIGTASAQVGQCRQIVLPNGTVLTCDVDASGQKVYTDPAGNVYPATSQGVGNFIVTNSNTNPCTAVLDPTGVNITSTNPVLGVITTSLDPTRPSTPSFIRSNGTSEFPATEVINFYARATVSSRPGRIYRSIQEVTLTNPNVTSFNPHVNEQFTLSRPVEFEDVNVPGVVAFTLKDVRVTLNGKR